MTFEACEFLVECERCSRVVLPPPRRSPYADSMMNVPSRIFIATVLPARPFVFLSTRQFMSVFEVFHMPSSTPQEFSRLPDS
jgi:hypothetical protein